MRTWTSAAALIPWSSLQARWDPIFAGHLVSHGFVYAGVNNIDTYEVICEEVLDQPLDIVFMLNRLATDPPQDLAGLIDAEHAGATGYSFDGYNSLAMSGARIDPQYYLAQCREPDAKTQANVDSGSVMWGYCRRSEGWDAFAAHAGPNITSSDDGLWQPLTDPRMRAVVPIASEGWLLFGERGLAAVDRPILMLTGARDGLYNEQALIFEHLGVADKSFISFVGWGHSMIYNPDQVARMAHFITAFFGYHLQGRQEWAEYFSEDFVNRYANLTWGTVRP